MIPQITPKEFAGTIWQTPIGVVRGVLFMERGLFVVVEPVDGERKGISVLLNKNDLIKRIS